jgi:hypothetical protein
MDELIMLVKPYHPLPSPGKTMYAPGALSGVMYEIKVNRIKRLAWNANGELLVTIAATRRQVKGAANGPEAAGTTE